MSNILYGQLRSYWCYGIFYSITKQLWPFGASIDRVVYKILFYYRITKKQFPKNSFQVCTNSVRYYKRDLGKMSKNEKKGRGRTEPIIEKYPCSVRNNNCKKGFLFFPYRIGAFVVHIESVYSLQLRDQVSSTTFILFLRYEKTRKLLWKSQLFVFKTPEFLSKDNQGISLKRSNSGTTRRGSQNVGQ